MTLKFGTSGIRGLVSEMTDMECVLYTKAFIQFIKDKAKESSNSIAFAGDLRTSTPRIIKAAGYAAQQESMPVDYCGFIPTPSLLYYGMSKNVASIMVTGSHIPDDRNGIKFNLPWGEVLKGDEKEISKRYRELKDREDILITDGISVFTRAGEFKQEPSLAIKDTSNEARELYINRYIDFFPPDCLSGLNIIFYEHSTVSREILPEILKGLGTRVFPIEKSDSFISVDTEAIDNPEQLSKWVSEYSSNALVSADGDGDRPLVVNEEGGIVRGDILGILVSDLLLADSVSTPVSCNTSLEKSNKFDSVSRTKIGSPYVISSMLDEIKKGRKRVVGYEANGGFLTGTDIDLAETGKTLKALPSRDAALPIIAVLYSSVKQGKSISEIFSALPERFTFSNLLRDFPTSIGKKLVSDMEKDNNLRGLFIDTFGEIKSINYTDGTRMTFLSDDVVHLRPSGNTPEFRCYTESSNEKKAIENNMIALEIVKKWNKDL